MHSGIPVELHIALYQQRSRARLPHGESSGESFRLLSHSGRRSLARPHPQLYLDPAQARPASARIPPPRPRRPPLPAGGITIYLSAYTILAPNPAAVLMWPRSDLGNYVWTTASASAPSPPAFISRIRLASISDACTETGVWT